MQRGACPAENQATRRSFALAFRAMDPTCTHDTYDAHRLLRDAPEGPFSTNLLWTRAIEEGRLYGTTFTGLWYEVGDPGAVVATEAALTRG